ARLGLNSNDTLISNTITEIGVDYHDAVGINVGYPVGARIVNNELYELPYTGISLGFSIFGAIPEASATVARNRIRGIMRKMNDGGGIYTRNRQAGLVIEQNCVSDLGQESWVFPRGVLGGVYLDEQSEGITVR